MVAAAVVGMWEGRRAFHITTTGKEVLLKKLCGKKFKSSDARRGSILFAKKGSKVLTIYIQQPAQRLFGTRRQGRRSSHRTS